MAQVIVTESSLQNIAGAIRSKLGTQDTYTPSEMAGAISQIHGDPVLEALSVNANGTYTPSSGKDGFSQAVVNVPNSYSSGDEGKVVSGGALVSQSSQSITQNGTYDTTLKNQAIVNVPNSYSASDEGKVVDNGALVAQGSQTITQNGTYDTTLKNQVTVNVSGGGGGSKNILGGTTNPTSADGTDGDIYIKYIDYSSVSGYTLLEYLQSNGNQSIDTGVDMTNQSYYETKCAATQSTQESNFYGIGYSNKESNIIVASNRIYLQIGSRNISISYDTNDHIYKADSNQMSIDNTVGTPNWSNVPTGQRIRLFATAYGGNFTSNRISYTKMYYCKIWDGATLVRDFVPAKRNSDDVLGMYDLVNDVFYTNSGTGSFIGGEELTGKPIDAAYLKVSGAWIPLEDGDWDDVNTGE